MVIIATFSAIAIEVTGQPGFCNSCHIMNTYYDSWQSSTHSEVNCLDCHLQPGFAGYVRGKINGLAQAIDCIVGRVGTKPNATVKDVSCLRPECHNTEELRPKNIDYRGTKFTHENHIAKVADGIKISCGTCHSHFEGDEHFGVDSVVCFTCHFLRNGDNSTRIAQTECTDCHEIPKRVIRRGLIEINHTEFVSYRASCDDSCHRRQIDKRSTVAGTVCLNCHSFRKQPDVGSAELHTIHTSGEKVECFECHGEIAHGPTEGRAITAMMSCENCHSDVHEAQRSIYTAQNHPQNGKPKRVLSPMFLTHVECTGCHIERVQKKSGTLDSFGTVAKAVPEACDRCHQPGTGQRYIPFWQSKIEKLYKEVSFKVDAFEERTQFETDHQLAQRLQQKIKQVRSVLEAVSADGSWGVHNFKYTEAMLLKVNEMINEGQ
jgi:nitrate/TMAO reductase-like tetraheme cytochrome c subunit